MYRDGFKNMTIGRTLWMIIIIKLVVMFLVIKLFFFPNILQQNFDDDATRAETVRSNLTDR